MSWKWEAVVLAGLSGGSLVWLTWACFISEFPNASSWRRGRERFLAAAENLGFEVSPENCTATKQVEGLPLTVGIKVTRNGSNSIVMSAQAPLSEVPSGLSVSHEMSVWGGSRALGADERTTGDPEFDKVFWLQCNDEEHLQRYLTLPRREAFLRWIEQVPTVRLTEQGFVAEREFITPLKMTDSTFRAFLSGLEGLVREYQGGEPGEVRPRASAVGASSSPQGVGYLKSKKSRLGVEVVDLERAGKPAREGRCEGSTESRPYLDRSAAGEVG